MNAIPYEDREEGWDRIDEEGHDDALPGRPRRHYFNRWSALLFAAIVGGACFYGGVRVEKSQLSSSSTGSGLTAAASTTGATGRAGARGAGTGAAGSAASRFGRLFGGAAGGAAAGGGFAAALGGGSSSIGTVSSVNGHTLYVTDTSGNTVKVTLSSATKITKSVSVGKGKIYPGDSVVIAGVKGSGGSLSATSLTDTGARGSGSGSASGSGSGSGSGPSSTGAVNSLFGGG